MHSPSDGRFGDSKHLGGFGMGELLAGDEHDRISQRGLQPSDRALDPDGIIGIAAVGRVGKARQHRELLGYSKE